jgi:hypothetical protein
MKSFCSSIRPGAAAAVSILGCLCLAAQSVIPAHMSNTVFVTTAMEKERVQVGESPKVFVTIKNLTDHAIYVGGCDSVRFYVQGEKGEPPTTRIERDFTGRLNPGEAPLPCTAVVIQQINPGGSYTSSAELKYFYDLSLPGKYAVYVEVTSPEGWLRTDPVQFEILAKGPTPQKDSH